MRTRPKGLLSHYDDIWLLECKCRRHRHRHPLELRGFALAITLARELKRSTGKYGIAPACVARGSRC